MDQTRGRQSETGPLEHGEPLSGLLYDTQIRIYDMVLPERPDADYWTPFRDRIPRADAPEYCNVCENFPCLGNHPVDEDHG
jgi:hypothetical protein